MKYEVVVNFTEDTLHMDDIQAERWIIEALEWAGYKDVSASMRAVDGVEK